jgi:hypothetical protein
VGRRPRTGGHEGIEEDRWCGEGDAMSPYSAEVCLLVFLWVFGIASFFEWRRLKKLVERERNRFLKSDETGEK